MLPHERSDFSALARAAFGTVMVLSATSSPDKVEPRRHLSFKVGPLNQLRRSGGSRSFFRTTMVVLQKRFRKVQRRLIIAAVLAFVLLSSLITDQTPAWVESIFGVAFFVAVVGLIAFSIISGTGWRALASTYPERIPYTGQWRYCRTFQMLALRSNQPFGTRFSGSIVAVGTTSSALYISLPPILRLLFPTIQLPWAAIVSAKPFEAPGWVTPIATPGAIFQAQYDPGFRGEFVELETKEPKVQIRLSMHALEEARSHLPLIPA